MAGDMNSLANGAPVPLALSRALPRKCTVPEVPASCDTYWWGAALLPWGVRVYGNGSALQSDEPEVRRCGWAIVEIGNDGYPVRAAYGPLPGPLQTAGRAERHAALRAIDIVGHLELFITDLESLAKEGGSWKPQLESATGRHAAIWRKMFALARGGKRRPDFHRVPSHKSVDEFLTAGYHWID